MRESTVGDPSLRPVAHSDDTIAIAACGAFLTSPIATSPPGANQNTRNHPEANPTKKRVGQWRLVEFLGMVTAFALCAELESRAFAVASERALSSVSHDGVGSLRSARQ